MPKYSLNVKLKHITLANRIIKNTKGIEPQRFPSTDGVTLKFQRKRDFNAVEGRMKAVIETFEEGAPYRRRNRFKSMNLDQLGVCVLEISETLADKMPTTSLAEMAAEHYLKQLREIGAGLRDLFTRTN